MIHCDTVGNQLTDAKREGVCGGGLNFEKTIISKYYGVIYDLKIDSEPGGIDSWAP